MLLDGKNCGHTIGDVEAIACITMLARLVVPVVMGAILLPVAPQILRRVSLSEAWPALLIIFAIWALVFFAFCCPRYTSWLANCRRRCPKCGQRKWSLGRFSGFGL